MCVDTTSVPGVWGAQKRVKRSLGTRDGMVVIHHMGVVNLTHIPGKSNPWTMFPAPLQASGAQWPRLLLSIKSHYSILGIYSLTCTHFRASNTFFSSISGYKLQTKMRNSSSLRDPSHNSEEFIIYCILVQRCMLAEARACWNPPPLKYNCCLFILPSIPHFRGSQNLASSVSNTYKP